MDILGSSTQVADWNAWIVGGLVVFNAGCALTGFAAWEEWTNPVLGLWAAASPRLFGFQGNVASYAGDWVTRLIRRRGEPAFW
jgi:hypothetical protein